MVCSNGTTMSKLWELRLRMRRLPAVPLNGTTAMISCRIAQLDGGGSGSSCIMLTFTVTGTSLITLLASISLAVESRARNAHIDGQVEDAALNASSRPGTQVMDGEHARAALRTRVAPLGGCLVRT